MDYMLKRIDAFTQFLNDGQICLSNSAAERALRESHGCSADLTVAVNEPR
jgi:Transposase IS66 family